MQDLTRLTNIYQLERYAKIMGLIETLESHRKGLTEMDWRDVNIADSFYESDLKGKIAQILVDEWLKRCEDIVLDDNFPRFAGRFNLRKSHMGVTAYDSRYKSLHEFDSMFYYDRNPCVAEVKSYKLHGFSKHIDSSLRFAEEVYSTKDISMLLIFPICTEKRRLACELQDKYPRLHCLDIGYTVRELEDFLECFEMTPNGFRYRK